MNYMSGDVQMSPIKMKSLNGDREADITGQVIEINVYEDLISPVITGQLIMQDAIDLLTQFPIIGEEQVTFSLQTPNGTKREFKLNVAHAVDGFIETNIKGRVYVLDLISPEFYDSKKQVITQKFKDSASNIIKSIVTGKIGSSKNIELETTQGIEDLVIDRLQPFPAIDFIRRRCVSPKYKSSSFCFFENKDGYHLVTLEGIFAKKKGSVGNKVYFYNNNVNYDTTVVTLRDIIAHEHTRLIDTPAGIGGTKVTTLDIVTGEVKETEYPDADSETIDKNGQNVNTSNFTSKYKNKATKTSVIPMDSTLKPAPIDEKIGQIQPLIARITANLLRLHVYGDTDITVGDVIEVRLPQVSGATKAQGTDRLYAGNYLIAKLRHIIEVSPRPYHTMSFELMKGSFLDNA